MSKTTFHLAEQASNCIIGYLPNKHKQGSNSGACYLKNGAARSRSRSRRVTPRNDQDSNSAMIALDADVMCVQKIFPSESSDAISNALRHRFDRLPIHKICRYQSYHSSETVLKKLNEAFAPSGARRLMCSSIGETDHLQDCLGMTPLHILACSTKHDPAHYRLMIEKYPESLITPDGWGYLPLLYAFWGNAPRQVVRLLVESHRAIFPEREVNWTGIVETLGRARYLPGKAGASLACIRDVLVARRRYCASSRDRDWQSIVIQWATEDTDRATELHAPRFHHDAFKYLISFAIAERLNSLGVDKWRMEILDEIEELRWFVCYRKKSTEYVFSKLARYECMDGLREAASFLELALWRASIDRSMATDRGSDTESLRRREKKKYDCRMCSGADVVVPNVLSFLLPT